MEANLEHDSFFSLYKLFWWAVYTFLLIGFLASWVFIRVNVMGADVAVDFAPSAKAERDR